MKFEKVVFREYDIRGVYNKEFDAEFAEHLGFSFVRYLQETRKLQKPKLTLGHDARLSSPEIKEAVSRGFRKAGADVVFLGMVTSPILYFSTFQLPEVDGGIMITGSHNPPEYNGFKVSVGKQTIFGQEIQNLRGLFETLLSQKQESGRSMGVETTLDILPAYVERYKSEFGQLKNFPLVLDCGNGAAGCVARKLFSACGMQPEILFETPDGRFPNHHPDPTVEKNLVDLAKAVRNSGARVGIGFDGDADRIGVVDQNGRMIFGDELMVILSRAILKKNKGAKIIGDVKCSDRLFSDIQKNGGEPVLWKTGHSLIKEKIKVEKAPFGGEMSGHIFFADRNYGTDDALYAALRVCEILSETGSSISELLNDLPASVNTPEIRVDTTEEKKLVAVEVLKKYFGQVEKNKERNIRVNLLDGVRVSYPKGWALVRSSNTQPVLVMRFEAQTQSDMKQIESEVRGIVDPILNG